MASVSALGYCTQASTGRTVYHPPKPQFHFPHCFPDPSLPLLHAAPDSLACAVRRPTSDPASVHMFCFLNETEPALTRRLRKSWQPGCWQAGTPWKHWALGSTFPLRLYRDLAITLKTSSICCLLFPSSSVYFPLPFPVPWDLYCS